jgi:hypothetical protein
VLCPAPIDADPNVTVTDATGGGVTVSVACPVLPSTVATMSAEPEATADTEPVASTVATEALDVDQVGAFPEMAAPWASRGVAVAVVV